MKYLICIVTVTIIIAIFGGMGYSIYTDVDYGVKQGIIVDRKYRNAYTSYTYVTSNINNSTISTPVPQYHPESYNIKIQKEEKRRNKRMLDNNYKRRIRKI